MKHKLNFRLTTFSLLLCIILAGFTPAQAGLTNSNQYYLLTGKIFLDGNLATSSDRELRFSIDAGEQGATSEKDGSYSIKVAGAVKLISFCYSTKGDMPYNTNSIHCSYLDTALITKKIGDSPLTYNFDFYYLTTPGQWLRGSITSPDKKVNGFFATSYIKVYSKQGMLESMNVFGNKYQISIPSVANRITFCKAGMECIESDPKINFSYLSNGLSILSC